MRIPALFCGRGSPRVRRRTAATSDRTRTAIGVVVGIGLACQMLATRTAAQPCTSACGDFSGDAFVSAPDVAPFLDCLGQPVDPPSPCRCADLDGSGAVGMADVALFQRLFGAGSDEAAPHCTGAAPAAANLTAYRPQHRGGYAPFQRTAISEADEADLLLGPGIRRNAPADVDPFGEDDLIEVQLDVAPAGAALALRRGDPALRVWTTRTRQAGTEIAFNGDKTGVLPIGPAQSSLTLWVEWAAAAHGEAELHVESPAVRTPKDTLLFRTFRSIVLALGGENQVPSDPPDPNAGTFVSAVDLYQSGYDVHMYDEDNVGADGSGATFNEAATAIRERGVTTVAIYGYSHGGGSTYDLADRLDVQRAGLGVFEIVWTSYVDSVSNDSDFDTAQELRRPPSTGFHVNHYQRGSFFQDLGLDGGPVPNSVPPPSGLDVETTPWGAGCTHFEVDDFPQVLNLMRSTLLSGVPIP
ncbi:MAG: hypothetical protein IPM64_02920 [Phycisphaerales bacterium]|nr:hypothetical protein [Phycisphaerales bacterium]